ncbi:MAG: C40 family peptidase, partial [Bacteroidia bacterium]|nr:C40 family peptidase [Bacteroidia bacterium]
VLNSTKNISTQTVIEAALRFLGSPYLWGGKTVYGCDCSGFVQVIYKLAGIKLKRDSHEQAEEGSHISLLEEASQGDLAFFDNKEGKIMHVGILLNDDKIIHASGKVRIDRIDHHGIFNDDLKTYSHNLRLIRRVI